MALEEYKRKRRFDQTPEPPAKLPAKPGHRFVIQKHRASHLHYDFRLEMEGVLKSWAVPKGPSLDPADKRLAMMVEDHPVSYFDFEGIIPPGNYGAGTVMVWDVGTWEALNYGADKSLVPFKPAEQDKAAAAMLAKGDLKFRLHGKKLNGDFVLARMRSRRPGSKGTEWLLIKKHDGYSVEGFDIDELDWSALSKRSLAEIGGDKDPREWQSNRKSSMRTSKKDDWLAESLAKVEARSGRERSGSPLAKSRAQRAISFDSKKSKSLASKKKVDESHWAERLRNLKGAERTAMPHAIHPELATLVDDPFNSDEWLFEIKWDGYRALAYVEGGKVRLVSRNQNEFKDYPELGEMPQYLRARNAIVDGEICALDEQGRASFSLMQQRTGVVPPGQHRHRGAPDRSVAVVYYAFDLLYLDGYSLMQVDLEKRKQLLREVLVENERFRYSEHFPDGKALYDVARQRGLEGIVAKRRTSCYLPKRTREWLKMKITQMQECVIGGYTDPRGSREHFGSLVLGLYDDKGRLIPVGQAGTGFTEKTQLDMWHQLKKIETDKSPFFGKPDSPRKIHWVKPVLVAEIKFTEWTHEGAGGSGLRMRAPVYQGIRTDKKPEECRFEIPHATAKEKSKAERGEAIA
jgi:bifunctional non-homologous end joining protein LigD